MSVKSIFGRTKLDTVRAIVTASVHMDGFYVEKGPGSNPAHVATGLAQPGVFCFQQQCQDFRGLHV